MKTSKSVKDDYTMKQQVMKRKAICDAILYCILDGARTPQTIGHRLNMKKTNLNYYLKRLRDNGLIVRSIRDRVASYDVTPTGITLLTTAHDKMINRVTRYEHLRIGFKVINDNPEFLPVAKGSTGLKGVIQTDGTIKIGEGAEYSVVRWHPSKQGYDEIQIHIGPRYGTNSTDVVSRAAQEALLVKQEIERRYKMTLSEPGRTIQDGHFGFYNKLAQLYIKGRGPNVTTDNDWIDRSPPGKGLSLEYGTPEAAQAFIDAPLLVPIMEKRLEELKKVKPYCALFGCRCPILSGRVDSS
jgi:predicted transcriptional regulator